MKSNKLILIAILIIAAFLRLYKISVVPVSLFGDELDVGYHAYSILKTGRDYQGNFMPLHFHSMAEWRTPLYLYSAVPTVAAFGITPLGVRLPAVIFGVLGVLGIYLLVKELLSCNQKPAKKHSPALLSALFLAISPWHLQYSRAGFEVTMLLAFLIFGLFFFLRSLNNSKYLWISVTLLAFTPWIYNTAKLFTPLLMAFLIIIWGKEILKIQKKDLLKGVLAGLFAGLPILISTVFGGGAQRAGYTSVFTDPVTAPEIGDARMMDILRRGKPILESKTVFWDRFFHNKLSSWVIKIGDNYVNSFSFNYLFSEGDSNLRHSPFGMGQFYKIEILSFIAGLLLFFSGTSDKKIKYLIVFWLLAGALPSALTRDGGNHATRLILILPPLILLISYGLVDLSRRLKLNLRYIFLTTYFLLLTTNFVFYLHNYYVHYPWQSENWWHAGIKESVQSIKQKESRYDKVVLSMSGEPMWIFFAAWSEYPPEKWQREFPVGNDIELPGFGRVSHIDKYYFGTFNVPGKSIYDLGQFIDAKTLYMANANEIGANLLLERERTPNDLKLIDAISYPSGAPAYYLFSGR